MKKNIIIFILVILTFVAPMITSWLLDWGWIRGQWIRQAIIILLIIFEMAALISAIREILQNK